MDSAPATSGKGRAHVSARRRTRRRAHSSECRTATTRRDTNSDRGGNGQQTASEPRNATRRDADGSSSSSSGSDDDGGGGWLQTMFETRDAARLVEAFGNLLTTIQHTYHASASDGIMPYTGEPHETVTPLPPDAPPGELSHLTRCLQCWRVSADHMHYLMIVAIGTVPGFRDFLLHSGHCPRERIEPFAHRVVDELDVFIMGWPPRTAPCSATRRKTPPLPRRDWALPIRGACATARRTTSPSPCATSTRAPTASDAGLARRRRRRRRRRWSRPRVRLKKHETRGETRARAAK
jgi:hypothetical protein